MQSGYSNGRGRGRGRGLSWEKNIESAWAAGDYFRTLVEFPRVLGRLWDGAALVDLLWCKGGGGFQPIAGRRSMETKQSFTPGLGFQASFTLRPVISNSVSTLLKRHPYSSASLTPAYAATVSRLMRFSSGLWAVDVVISELSALI